MRSFRSPDTKKLITCSIQSYQELGGRLNYSAPSFLSPFFVFLRLPLSLSDSLSLSLSLSLSIFLSFYLSLLGFLSLCSQVFSTLYPENVSTTTISVFNTDEKTNRASAFLNRFRARPCSCVLYKVAFSLVSLLGKFCR